MLPDLIRQNAVEVCVLAPLWTVYIFPDIGSVYLSLDLFLSII